MKKNIFFIIEKIQKHRKCPALRGTHTPTPRVTATKFLIDSCRERDRERERERERERQRERERETEREREREREQGCQVGLPRPNMTNLAFF